MSSLNGFPNHILILGDEARSAQAIERLLQAASHPTIFVGSFQSAGELIHAGSVSLLIIDVTASRIVKPLEGTDADDSGVSRCRQAWAQEAIEFCRVTRSDADHGDLPILIICKSQNAHDKVAALNAGATDYITKPYQKAELLSRINVHLRSWRYEREISRRLEELNLLHSVSSVLASSLQPEVLLRETLSAVVKAVNAAAGVVYLSDPTGRSVGVAALVGFGESEADQGALIDLYFKTVPLSHERPLMLEPLPAAMRKGAAGRLIEGFSGLLSNPLGARGNTIGSLSLFSHKQSPFAERLSDLFSTICNQLSVALENARHYVETKKSAAQLSFVYNLGNNLMTSLEMDELLGYAVFTVGKSLECDVCAVVVRNTNAQTGSGDLPLASAIYSRAHTDSHGSTADWCETDRVMRYLDANRTAVRMSIETRTSERFLKDSTLTSETIVPLMFDDMTLGLLICSDKGLRSFSQEEMKLLASVAQQLSLAIRNTELFQRTKDTSITLAIEIAKQTREIEEQKRFTEKIIDSLPVSLYVVDRDMRIVAWNRNRELGGSGISREEVLGRNVFQVLARQPRRILQDEFVDVFRSGDIVRMEQESFIDGQKKDWRISKIPMRVDNAEVTHVITVGEDITEQKKMNDAVIHAEKLASIGRLAAGVVHELNNPLATIAACAEALNARLDEIKDSGNETDFAEYLEIMHNEAFRCKTITNSLLDFAHQRQAEKNPGDINNIIDQTLQLVRHHPKLGKMRVIKDLDSSLAPISVNEGQMKQIFIALISNAFDAMELDGTLTIRTRWNSENPIPTICAEFSDTGCGIPPSDLPKIFDPFFTTKPLGRGTGLGLSVCYGIVSEHGGRIEVDSAEGQGSTFRVLLPVPTDAVVETTL